jgi:hypothetical protein
MPAGCALTASAKAGEQQRQTAVKPELCTARNRVKIAPRTFAQREGQLMASKKRSGGKARKGSVRRVKRLAKGAKKSAPSRKAHRYDPQTGQLTGREKRGQERLKARAEELQRQGMTEADARNAARQEMRSHQGREDWRHG